ncbi:hypothetical protein R6Q59_025483 [Mikania micrantha]
MGAKVYPFNEVPAHQGSVLEGHVLDLKSDMIIGYSFASQPCEPTVSRPCYQCLVTWTSHEPPQPPQEETALRKPPDPLYPFFATGDLPYERISGSYTQSYIDTIHNRCNIRIVRSLLLRDDNDLFVAGLQESILASTSLKDYLMFYVFAKGQ